MKSFSPRTLKRIFITGIAASALAISGCAQISIPAIGGTGGGSQTADAGKIGAAVTVSLISLNLALEQYLLAIGNAEAAAKAKDNADGLQSGARKQDEGITTTTDLSKSLVDGFKKSSETAGKLDEAGKERLVKGMALHITGTVAAVKAGKDLSEAMKSRSPATMAALTALAGFPPMLATWADTTNAVAKYAEGQGVATAEFAKNAADAMKP